MKNMSEAFRVALIPAILALGACGGRGDPGPIPENTPPSVADPGPISVEENSSLVAQLDIGDAEGNPLEITLTGPDAASFTLSESGELRFAILADYENPADAGRDNVYNITVTVTDTYTPPTTVDLVVTVTDVPNDVVAEYVPAVATTATEGLTTDEYTFDPDSLIESFERPSDFSNFPGKFILTGVFADSQIATRGWSNFNDRADAAYVGSGAVSTCEIDGAAGNCDLPTGSVTIRDVEVARSYIQFLMSGGNGSNDVGIELLFNSAATDGRDVALGVYTPNSCGDAWVKGDQHWVHFDVSDMIGETVSLRIRDNETSGCGFLAFDHLYQTENALGTFAGKINKPAEPGVDTDGDGVDDADDAFPNDPSETMDSDADGVGDNADAFPNDPAESQDTDGDGVGDNSDARPQDPDVTLVALGVTVNDEAIDPANVIASFDDPVALQTAADYTLTGVFDDDEVAAGGWINFADSARVGAGSVSTCEIDGAPGNCDAPTGSITVHNVEITSDYLMFMMAGGDGSAPVGLDVLLSSNRQQLGSYVPATCGATPPWLTGDGDWVHFDVSALVGNTVDIHIYDDEPGGCGFLAFDHVYQGNTPVGALASVLAAPGMDSDGDGVPDGEDAFPGDPAETADTDSDGVGDNADVFPNDPAESQDTDGDGVGDNADSDPNDPNVTLQVAGVTLNPEGALTDNVIASFDDPVAVQADTARYELTGVFADPAIAATGWNDLQGRDDAARVGAASVSTCEIGDGNCDGPTGTIRIRDVTVNGNYINFLMSGGTGSNDIGVQVLLSLDGSALGSYTPASCGNPVVSTDDHWVHFDVSDLVGLEVDLLIHDNEEGGCGFISFDHFYQGDTAVGTAAGTLVAPLLPTNVTTGDGVAAGLVAGGSFESPADTLAGGWEAAGDFADPATETAWQGTAGGGTAARIGNRAVSTCEMNDNAAGCDAPTGAVTSPAFQVTASHLQFLLAGGNGTAPVGVRVLDTVGNQLLGFNPNSCGPSFIDGDNDWTFVDMSAIANAFIRVSFFDEEPGGCGFVSFDHLYQTNSVHLPDTSVDAGTVAAAPTLGYNVTLSADAFEQVIGDFDDASLMGSASRPWSGTGVFETPAHPDFWQGVSGHARVGDRAVTTCEINDNAAGCDAPVGVLTSPDFMVESARPWLTLLMSGGNGTAPVGLRVLAAGDGSELAAYTPNSCGPAFIDGDDDWVSIDLSASAGSMVRIEIFDNETGGCGFLSFDHVHMSAAPRN